MAHLSEAVALGGLILAALGFAWLVALGFERGIVWGVCLLLFPPSALVLAAIERRRSWKPLVFVVVGALVAVGAWLQRRPQLAKAWDVGKWTWGASEQGAFLFLATGLVLIAVGFLALVISAFRVRIPWGVGTLLFPPVGLVFACRHWPKSRVPAALILVGLVIAGAPVVLTRYVLPIDLGPRERIVDGERHLTLTGWDRHDYSFLSQKPDVVVLQMANPDVTDRTLDLLKGMSRLRELDLERTAITDQGLRILARLPSLEILRLKDTKITDAGFRDTMGASETLRMIDLRGTSVASGTIQAWRRAKPGRRALY